jgi:hypothetical protein
VFPYLRKALPKAKEERAGEVAAVPEAAEGVPTAKERVEVGVTQAREKVIRARLALVGVIEAKGREMVKGIGGVTGIANGDLLENSKVQGKGAPITMPDETYLLSRRWIETGTMERERGLPKTTVFVHLVISMCPPPRLPARPILK